MGEENQTFGEEIANSVSHGIGAIAALVFLPILIAHALHGRGGAPSVFASAVFGATAALLYIASTVYHALPPGPAKARLRLAEHAAIFLLIAGTYTPFTLGALRGTTLGTVLLAAVWILAAVGIVLKVVDGHRHPVLMTGLYVGMGWLALLAIGPLWRQLPHGGFYCLLGGGASYTLGVVFYAIDGRLRFGHFIWHLFVLAGTALHVAAALWIPA